MTQRANLITHGIIATGHRYPSITVLSPCMTHVIWIQDCPLNKGVLIRLVLHNPLVTSEKVGRFQYDADRPQFEQQDDDGERQVHPPRNDNGQRRLQVCQCCDW